MAGEVPSEEAYFDTIQRFGAGVVERLALGRTTEMVGDDDMMTSTFLPQLYVAINGLYALRGQSRQLDDSLRNAAESIAQNAKEREALLAEYGFGSDTEAAEHIAGYWQGERPDDLLRSIMGFGEIELWRQASRFADDATKDDPDAKQQFHRASNLLWRNYRGGHG